ncbi:hypothetical protein DQ04_00941000 [Trypanosoma grayi]|uniref:hypothetical protein n=1 Tax=Trypanosoma grayi TaxID=71804 RepID=UPI0004F4AA4A|nr:hypothetical protein DQ04_00941000 [Trypanosoma grayi]KEG13536.1 hypothetical protein DQ04_00941000 [Trypanosoma grayi]
MVQEVPQCLVQLLADYTSQAVDASRDVSDEFEEEVSDLANRAKRIRSILQLIRDCANERRSHLPPEGVAATMTTTTTGMKTTWTPAMIALQGLGQMAAELTGVPAVGPMVTNAGSPHYGLLPCGKPTSLAEASLALFSHNTKVVFRRSEKHGRDSDAVGSGTSRTEFHRGAFSRLAADQRKRRLALYTARSALFPREVFSPPSVMRGGEGSLTPFVPPAVREFAELNMEAECEMLAAFCRVDTKAQLLRELPTLRATVEDLWNSLRAEGVALETQGDRQEPQQERMLMPPWFEFPYTEEGVVQVVVRRSLVVDITWDAARGSHWRVLSLRWILCAQTLPELLLRGSLATGAGSGNSSRGEAAFGGAGNALRVLPAHQEASLRYLSSCFELGLEKGCMGALRLVNAVAMEVVETQCKILRETFFIGPLEASFVVDVRPGTHVALTLLSPSVAGAAPSGPLHMKYKLSMGTIVMEKRRGTDTQTMLQSDLYVDALSGRDGLLSAAVVDVERHLWQFVSA